MNTIVIDKTMQEIFDGTVEHLAKQGKPALLEGVCKYTLKLPDETLHCGIGIHIPQDQYREEFEGKSIDSLMGDKKWLDFPKCRMDFLMEMQRAHDISKGLRELKERLFYVANTFHLNSDKLALLNKWEVSYE